MWPFSFFGRSRSNGSAPQLMIAVASPPNAGGPSVDLDLLNRSVDVDEGLPLVDPSAVVEYFREEILETRYTLGIGAQPFDEVCAPLIHTLADWLQTLPATRSDQFRRPLGAMKRAILTGRACARAGTAVIFDPDATQSERKLLQAHWRVACFTAGMAGELGFLLDQLDVVSANGETWRPTVGLHTWSRSRGIDRVWLRWRHKTAPREPSSAADGYVANLVVPKRTLDFLHAGSGEIARVALDAVVGAQSDRGRTLLTLIANAREQVKAMDLDSDPVHYGRPVIGVVLAEFVVQAMRECLARGRWTVNERMSAVFHTVHGTFIKWPYAAAEMRARIAEKRVAPVPDDDDQLLRTLADAGLIEASPGTGLMTQLWTIEPACCGKSLQAIKLRSAHVLCAERDPWQPIECRLTLPRDVSAASTAFDSSANDKVSPKSAARVAKQPRKQASPVQQQDLLTPIPTPAPPPEPAQPTPSPAPNDRSVIAAIENRVETVLSGPERICLRRFAMMCWTGQPVVARATVESAGLPFAPVSEVLTRLQGAVLNDGNLELTPDFQRYLMETMTNA